MENINSGYLREGWIETLVSVLLIIILSNFLLKKSPILGIFEGIRSYEG